MSARSRKYVLFVTSLVIVIVGIGIAVLLRNLPYFSISEVNLEVTGTDNKVQLDIQKSCNSLYDKNIFAINTAKVRNSISKNDCVVNVSVKRFFPNKIIVHVDYKDYAVALFSGNDCFLCKNSEIDRVKKENWILYSNIPSVEISSSYAKLLELNGVDEGFLQMYALVQSLGSNSLITYMRYDNNYTDGFGQLSIRFGASEIEMKVCDPVTPSRLETALGIVSDNIERGMTDYEFFLYAGTMVQRQKGSN